MRRRNLLIGLGGVAGVGGIVGSGAFTSVSAERSVQVAVADDDQALLAMEPTTGPNGTFASLNNGQITLDFDQTAAGGQGVGLDSIYNFDDVFRITNQGTQTVYAWVTFDFSGTPLSSDDVWLYPDSDPSKRLNDGSNSVVTLPVGETVNMGVHVDTHPLSSLSDLTLDATIHANVDKPTNSGSVGAGGDETAVVSKNPDAGDFSSIQAAIDSVSGSTVYIEPGTYEERPVIDSSTSGLTVRGAGESQVVVDASDDSQFTNPYGFRVDGDDITLEDFTLKGPVQPPSDSSYPASYFGLKISGGTGIHVENVTVEGSSLSEIDLNSVTDAVLRNVTADGQNPNAASTGGTGLFLTNCRDVTIDGITTRNNDWGGIAISAWNASYPRPYPTARDVELVGTNTIEDDPILYTEEQPASTYHTGSNRGSTVDTGGDSDWDVSFPVDGDVSSTHDVTGATVDTGSTSGNLSYSLTYERSKNGNPDQVAELYYVSESERDQAETELSNATGTFTYSILRTDDLTT